MQTATYVTGMDRMDPGGERGIRTLDGLLTHTPLAGERLQPLGHLSKSEILVNNTLVLLSLLVVCSVILLEPHLCNYFPER